MLPLKRCAGIFYGYSAFKLLKVSGGRVKHRSGNLEPLPA